ncbi:hypothetical protein [Pontibacter ruber]|uniref:Uncharacterized protein n=1 Tax=Pontibacter ruber TaxID=1343895 RepID=A0ABW5CUF1_9BACT|nr:hypothetical protein [Pontibacter ruber]
MIRPTFSLLLTLSILLSSAGIALSEQLCLMTGLKQLPSQEQTDTCCSEPDSGSDKEECCTVKVSFEKLEPVSTLKAFHLEIPVFFAENSKPLPLPWLHVPVPLQVTLTYSDSSPPRHGKQLLHYLHTLIV